MKRLLAILTMTVVVTGSVLQLGSAAAVGPDEFINDHVLLMSGNIWHSAPTVVDLDRDGRLEIIACADGGGVYVWHADGQLVSGWPQKPGRVCCAPAVGDIDGDRKLEIVVNGTHAWHYDGTALPGWPQPEQTGSCFSPPALADLNRDGKLEIVNGSASRAVHVRDWRGRELKGWPQKVGGEVRAAPAIGDIDGDRKPEIVVGTYEFHLYAWHASGTPVRGWPIGLGTRIEQQVVLCDLDRDGKLDVLAGSDRLYAFNGKGQPLPGWKGGKRWSRYNAPCVADINRDGKPEIFSTQGWWYRFDGREIEHGANMPGNGLANSPVVGDVDSDGRVELLWTTCWDEVPAYRSDASQPPGWPLRYLSRGSDAACALADVDGNGDVDVIVPTAHNRVFVFDAPGRFAAGAMPWPQVGANNRRTGVATEVERLAPRGRSSHSRSPVRLALAHGDFAGALRYYERIAATSTDSSRRGRARLSIARIYFPRMNDPGAAARTYAQLLSSGAPPSVMIEAGLETSELARLCLDSDPSLRPALHAAAEGYATWLDGNQSLPDRQLGQARLVLALLYRYDQDPQALTVAQAVADQFPGQYYGTVAAEIVRYGAAQYALRLDTWEVVHNNIEALSLVPGDKMPVTTESELRITATSPTADIFPSTVTVETERPVRAGFAPADSVEQKGDTTRMVWTSGVRSRSYTGESRWCSPPAEVTNTDATITRSLEALGHDRYRVTVTVAVPGATEFAAYIYKPGYSIETDTLSPGLEAATSDTVWRHYNQRGQPTAPPGTESRTHSFVIRAPKGGQAWMPDVTVGIRGSTYEPSDPASPVSNTYKGQCRQWRFQVSSPSPFRIERRGDISLTFYQLKSMPWSAMQAK